MRMKPEPEPARARWSAVRSILEGALALPAGERAAFVRAAARGDAPLGAEVLELLAGEAGIDALDAPDPPGGAEPGEVLPRRLGPYELLRRVGAGGMGSVYLALRADGQFRRRVAVKLIKRGMDTEEVLRRFERERQVLAGLDHPGIARLLDGGMSEDGRPYLVLEFVEGEPLDRWCDAQGSSVRERIELFLQVCDAVDEAHRALVVHRDLKPDNVLVDASGRPKLLDFGIAKVLDPQRGFATVDLTATPLRLLTPAYASPEQVRGLPIGVASDVYSLGAILFELLAGTRPLAFATNSWPEIERVVCEVQPPRPSLALAQDGRAAEIAARRATTPRALRRALEGDLDTIVLEALRKEPRRRYASAAGLAADLRRHLDGAPVVARPPTVRYRAAKFVRRNRLAVASSALVLAALVGGLGLSLWQYRAARRANAQLALQHAEARARAEELGLLAAELRERSDEAEAARGEAERQRAATERRADDVRELATTLIFDVHRALVPLAGALPARELVVRLGLRFLDRLAEEGARDVALRRGLVGGYLRIAEVQCDDQADNLGQAPEALASLEKALAIAGGLVEESPDDPAHDFCLGSALLQKGDLLRLLGRQDEARACFESAARRCGWEQPPRASNAGRDHVLAASLFRLGDDRLAWGELERAEELLTQSRAAFARVPGAAGRRMDLAEVSLSLGDLRRQRGDYAAAVLVFQEALALLEEARRAAPDDASTRRTLQHLWLSLARVQLEEGDAAGALALARQQLADLDLLLRADPEDELMRAERLRALLLAADASRAAGEAAEAERLGQEGVALARALLALRPGDAFLRYDLGHALVGLAESQEAGERWSEARRSLEAAIETFAATAPAGRPEPRGLRALAGARGRLGSFSRRRAAQVATPEERRLWTERACEAFGGALAALDALPDRGSASLPALRRTLEAEADRCRDDG